MNKSLSIRGVFDKESLNKLIPTDSKLIFISDRIGPKIMTRCSCGSESNAWVTNVLKGFSKQCTKCQAVNQKTKTNFLSHGLSKTKLYNVWSGIKRRCYNVNQKSYPDYGAKGIRMCDEWLNSYPAFYEFSVDNGYQEGLQIDRIDSSGNYEPSNCRFISRDENISRAHKGKKVHLQHIEKYVAAKLNISFEEMDDLIECSLSGLFKNKELADAAGIERHTLTRMVKRYGFSPIWSA